MWNLQSYPTTVLNERMWHLGGRKHTVTPIYFPGADLTGGHSCSGRRGPWEVGPWRLPGLGPRKAKFWLAIAKSMTATWIECMIYVKLKRVRWFGVLFFQNFNKEISYFLTDNLPLVLKLHDFRRKWPISRKRCEIGRWWLWNITRKSWVPDLVL